MGHHIHEYIAGAVGGAAGLVVGHPFDTTKVQLQTRQASIPYRNTLEAIRSIHHEGMVRGFFRGLGFPLVTYGVVNSVFFGVYGNTLRFMVGGEKASYKQVAVAGAVGGFAQLTVAVPVDAVKVVLQSQIANTAGSPVTQRTSYFTGPRECLAATYRFGGIPACYRGLHIQCMRDIPASSIYFLLYEALNDYLTGHQWGDRQGIAASLLAGGLAGVFSWLPIMPLDAVKSQLQSDLSGTRYNGILDCARRIYEQRGLRGFYAGVAVNSVRAFLVNAVIFAVHNQTMGLLRSYKLPETQQHTCITN